MLDSPDSDGNPVPSSEELFAGSTEAILVHDADDGTVVDANPTAERLYGYEAGDLCGRGVGDLLAGDRTQDTDVTTLADAGDSVTWHVQHPDEERRWLDVSFQRGTGGEYIISFGRDITTEQIQRHTLDQRERALETAIDGMAIVDSDLEFAYVNAPFATMHGYGDPDDLIGTPWARLYEDDEWERLEGRMLSAVETQGEWRGEANGQRASGESFSKELSAERLDDGSLVLVVRDVTDLEKREQVLRENQQTLRRLQEIVSRRDTDFDEKVTQLLELGQEWLGLSVGYMTRIDDGTQSVTAAVGDHEKIRAGETAPLSKSYCQHTLAADDPIHSFEDVADTDMLDTAAFATFGLSCYMGGTVTVGGEDYGTVCFADTEPREEAFTGMEQTFVDLITQWLGMTLERQHQAEQLREENELTTAILDSSPTAILVFDADGAVTVANDRATEVLGVETELEGTAGLPLDLYDGVDPVADSDMPQRRVARAETLHNVRYRLGDSRYVSVSGRPLAADGRGGVVLTVEDVTDQHRHIDAMRALSDTLASATGSFDDQLQDLLDVGRAHLGLSNGHLTEITDGTHTIVTSEGLPDLLHAGAESALEETFCQSVVDTDGLCSVTEASTELDDSMPSEARGLETYIGTTVTVDGEMYGTICFVDTAARDRPFSPWEQTFVETLGRWVETQIRQRRKAAQRDRDRALLEGVFDSQRTQVGITDTEGRVIDANEAALSFVDAEATEVTGTPVWETPWFSSERGKRKCKAGVERALDGEMTNFEQTYESEDGDSTTFSVNIRPVFDDDSVIHVVVEGYDITELRARERELERRQRHIDTILQNVPLVLFAVDDSGEFVDSRGRGLSAFDLEEGELVGETIYDTYGEFPEIIDDYERARDGADVESVRTVGETVFRSWYRRVEIEGEPRVIGITIDITERERQKERVAAVNEATERLMYVRTPAEVGQTVVDIVGDLISFPMAGVWVPDETGDELVPIAATDRTVALMDGDTAEDALPTIESGSMEMAVFESGETRVIESYTDTDGQMGQRKPIETVVMVPLGDYGVLHVGSPTPRQPSDTEMDLIEILARNAEAALVSTTREVELEAYKDELERSNRALQEFAYIASHDLQEPLRMVSSYVDLLESEYADQLDEEASEYMDFAVDGAHRMQNMIDALLKYSRVETQGNAIERVDTDAVLDRTLDALQLRIDETDAAVTLGSIPDVRADPNQLGQLVQNLLENAIQYADQDGADPEIRIDATREGGTVTVTVADNGPGIPDGMGEDVFEIFNRGGNHDTEGTGIGLAVCRRIVRRHDGEIWVAETDDPGATFRFTLPTPQEVSGDD